MPLPSVPAILAPVSTIIAPILAPIAAAADAPDRNRSCAGHRSSPRDRSPAEHAASTPSTST
jgi:hypothetical protein